MTHNKAILFNVQCNANNYKFLIKNKQTNQSKSYKSSMSVTKIHKPIEFIFICLCLFEFQFICANTELMQFKQLVFFSCIFSLQSIANLNDFSDRCFSILIELLAFLCDKFNSIGKYFIWITKEKKKSDNYWLNQKLWIMCVRYVGKQKMLFFLF